MITPSDPRSPYDPEEPDEEDLWFLPAPPEDIDPTAPPWPVARRAQPLEDQDWLNAEDKLGRALSDAAAAFARLDERLSHRPQAHPRLALMAVSAAFEAEGIWIPTERLALYLALREGTREQAQDLSRADWAHRRLISSLDPFDDLQAYLGRQQTEHDGLEGITEQIHGVAFRTEGERWIDRVSGLESAHPLTQAAAGFHLWRLSELAPEGTIVEAMVVTAALGAVGSRTCQFVPASLGARQDLLTRGSAKLRLSGWLRATTHGCQRLLMELEKIADWQDRAGQQTKHLSGRTVPFLCEALIANQLVSAEMLATLSGVSRAAALRNLTLFAEMGLVREVTGQSRYRFWTLV